MNKVKNPLQYRATFSKKTTRIYTFSAMGYAILATAAPTWAQDGPQGPDLSSFIDENGVNLLNGQISGPRHTVSVGDPNQGGLAYTLFFDNRGRQTSTLTGRIRHIGGGEYTVIIGGEAKEFWNALSGGGKIEARLEGHTLVQSADRQQMVYTKPNGTIYLFSKHSPGTTTNGSYYLISITYSNGIVVTYHHDKPSVGRRLMSVNSSLGYQIKFNYDSNNRLTDVTALNNAYEYCNPTDQSCEFFSSAWQKMVFGPGCDELWYNLADPQVQVQPNSTCSSTISESHGNSVTQYNFALKTIQSIVDPTGRETYYTFDQALGERRVTKISDGRGTWIYNFGSASSLHNFTKSTNPSGAFKTAYWWHNGEFISSIVDEIGRTTSISYDDSVRPIEMIMPSGGRNVYTYDDRGNLTEVRKVDNTASLTDMFVSAVYPVNCTNPVNCNKPTLVTDAKGSATTFTYDPVHGGVLTETSPSVGGVVPVKRYSYVQRYAWVLNSLGAITQSATPIWMLSEQRTCRVTTTIGNSCEGGFVDEIVTTYEYGPNGDPNNLLLRGVAVLANSQITRTCYGYDLLGNRTSETTPNAGLGVCS